MEQEQLLGRLSGLVDHLREGEEEKLSLADVASVTEVLIGTMDSYFRSIDTSIYRECRALSDYISNARLEIAALSPKDLESARIPRAGLELDAIVQQTEEATNTIMTSAEEILAALEGDAAENKESIEAAVMQIFEACSFQDITGQRISKVVSTLAHIEQRVKDLHDLMGVTDEHIDAAQTDDIDPTAHSSDELARGPSLDGEGIDQSEVDSLLGGDTKADQDDIDALMAGDGGSESGDGDAAEESPAEDAAEAPENSEEAPEAVAATSNGAKQEPQKGEDEEAPAEEAPTESTASEAEDADAEDDSALEVKGRTTSQAEIDSLFS